MYGDGSFGGQGGYYLDLDAARKYIILPPRCLVPIWLGSGFKNSYEPRYPCQVAEEIMSWLQALNHLPTALTKAINRGPCVEELLPSYSRKQIQPVASPSRYFLPLSP
jgi:hypothetical protein